MACLFKSSKPVIRLTTGHCSWLLASSRQHSKLISAIEVDCVVFGLKKQCPKVSLITDDDDSRPSAPVQPAAVSKLVGHRGHCLGAAAQPSWPC